MDAKRPKDMTEAEREALPTGPTMRVDAKLVRRGTMATHWLRDDIMLWTDSKGRDWQFGQFTDGQWFKRSFNL